jgi:MFS superfamily sulfate permease-like transporter
MTQSPFAKDFLASWVVFLVALPLCMGIAIASGMPPASGIVTGILGGILVGALSGSPLQVSGPAAGLAVIVFQLVRDHGFEAIGPILVVAGALQMVAGKFKLGRWFRAMSPAVVYGMLSGIGILLIGGQFYVMLDDKPRQTGLDNLIGMPSEMLHDIVGDHRYAAALGLLTMAVLVGWNVFRPKKLKLVPGALIAVVIATIVAAIWKFPVHHVEVPGNLLNAIHLPRAAGFSEFRHSYMLISAIAMAFVASAETLLSASAVDRLHTGPRADYDRELFAQGVGNTLCGFLGGLPMTGVIVRSSTNVQAGAITRLSAILHGVWLLAFVVALPHVLSMVPTASLAAILVCTGFKLIEWDNVKALSRYGRIPIAIYAATVIGIVAADLLTGVIVGLILSLMKLLYKISQITVRFEQDREYHEAHLHIEGAATFLNIPELASILDQIPPGTALHVHTAELMYIDHACLDLLTTWSEQQRATGGKLIVEWEHLMARFQRQRVDVSEFEPYVD